jgi:diguanylate cyclase (GGDEF)-like protein
LEESFGSAIRHHHDRVNPSTSSRKQSLNSILQAASLGAAVLFSSRTSAASLGLSLEQWVGFMTTHFAITAAQTEELLSEVNQRVEQYSILFKFNIGQRVQSDRVVAEAKDLLQEIALKNQLQLISRKPKTGSRNVDSNELYRDSLSGLFNRRFLDEQLNERLDICFRRQTPIALMFLDVDKFKKINDTFGHAAGDKAIQHVASWLRESTRKNDLVIRLGGDEFLVVLKTLNENQFEHVANRIAREVPPMELSDGQQVEISLSVGCTIYQPTAGDAVDVNWLIEQADQSMYRAKKSGGDSVSVQRFVGSNLAKV